MIKIWCYTRVRRASGRRMNSKYSIFTYLILLQNINAGGYDACGPRTRLRPYVREGENKADLRGGEYDVKNITDGGLYG
jgi:hypothetical protein